MLFRLHTNLGKFKIQAETPVQAQAALARQLKKPFIVDKIKRAKPEKGN